MGIDLGSASAPANALATARPLRPRQLRVEDASHVGAARRLATALCQEIGFDEARTASVALVVTELATNLAKHTAGLGGEIVLRAIDGAGAAGTQGIEILSLDRGPGMASVAASLRDGCSTAGSAGIGLGAIRRLSALFDIHSLPGKGTALLSRLWAGAPPAVAALDVGAVCLPLRGESACGDAWALKQGPGSTLLMLVDGLGHGPEAEAAAQRAVAIFSTPAWHSPAEWLQRLHEGLRGSRGAAVAVVELATLGSHQHELRHAGVGNTCGLLVWPGSSRSMLSHNGTAGVAVRKIQQFNHPWPEGAMLVLHSDGLATHWALADWPGLAQRHPALIAGVLYRDRHRPHDDSTVVVLGMHRAPTETSR